MKISSKYVFGTGYANKVQKKLPLSAAYVATDAHAPQTPFEALLSIGTGSAPTSDFIDGFRLSLVKTGDCTLNL
jgi:hypothetical protein